MTAILSFSFRIWNKIFFKKANRFFRLDSYFLYSQGFMPSKTHYPLTNLEKELYKFEFIRKRSIRLLLGRQMQSGRVLELVF